MLPAMSFRPLPSSWSELGPSALRGSAQMGVAMLRKLLRSRLAPLAALGVLLLGIMGVFAAQGISGRSLLGTAISPNTNADPAAVSWGAGRIDVFTRAT